MRGPISFEVEHALPGGARAGPPAVTARAGVIETPHGSFNTPAFVAVGTKATVKGVLPRDLKETVGAEVALANTYHLFLQPGEDVVAEAGGLHSFMDWQGPLVTDSGGFQVFSLGAGFGKSVSKFFAPEEAIKTGSPVIYDEDIRTKHGRLAIVDEEGVTFTSHIDGSLHRFTPERSVEIQHKLGADIFFAFDECTSPTATREYQKEAMERTRQWAKRSLTAHRQNAEAQKKQAIFGIVQGGRYTDLRKQSAEEISQMDFDGFGIGGSFSKADLGEALVAAIQPLPPEKPRHLLGIGEPEDLFEGVANGIDMFDCVLPTRLGRTGTIYTKRGKISLTKNEFIKDFSPLDVETGGYASDHFSRAYLSHLFRSGEMLGGTIASLHNLYFIVSLMKDIRQSIVGEKFEAFRRDFLQKYQKEYTG